MIPLANHILFPDSGTVVTVAMVADSKGKQTKVYTPVPGIQNVPYRMAPIILHRPTDVEEAQAKLSERTIVRIVALASYYPQITTMMEFLDQDGLYWDITSVQSDGNKIYTRMRVQRVLP